MDGYKSQSIIGINSCTPGPGRAGMNPRMVAVGATAIVVVLIAVGVGAAILLDDSYDPIQRPTWHSGYTYSYVVGGDAEAMYSEDGERDTDSDVMEPFAYTYEVYSTKTNHRGEPVYLALSDLQLPRAWVNIRYPTPSATFPLLPDLDGGLTVNLPDRTALAYRHRDLAPIQAAAQFNCDDTCRATGINLGQLPATVFLDFPLEEGKTWRGSDGLHAGGDIEAFDVTARAGEMERISVPAGSFDAVRVVIVHRATGLDEVEREVREEAGRGGIDVKEFDLDFRIDQIIHYAPAVSAVVRAETTVVGTFVSRYVENGREHEARAYAHATVFEELAGATLVSKPERSIDGLLAAINGEAPIDLPDDAVVEDAAREPRADYYLDVVPDQRAVNAADSPRITVNGNHNLPATAQVFHTVTRLGEVVEEGVALPFFLDIKEPGVYTIAARALDLDGDVLASDGASVIANYEATLPAECVPGPTSAITGCDPVPLPVHPGVQWLRVTVEPGALDRGELVVRDADGNAVEGELSGDGTQIEIERFAGTAVDSDSWEVEWIATVGTATEIAYAVDVEYGTLGVEESRSAGPWMQDLARRLLGGPEIS